MATKKALKTMFGIHPMGKIGSSPQQMPDGQLVHITRAAVLNGKIYVFGGGNYVPDYYAKNDVWSSEDGIHWTKICDGAPWHERLWFSSVVYRNRIWVMAGWSNNPYKNWSDVWYSKDGKDWTQFTSEVVWKERHEPSAFVFKDKIWIAGGMTPPLVNDVWSLGLPKGW